MVVCHFYDVESGRLALDQRGRGGSVERFDVPIPRDGGIQDLLAEAVRPNRRFDAVICESTARVARRMFESLSVERALEQAGVPLFAWNEPIKIGGGRAQQILQRRINQSVAEYEVFNALEDQRVDTLGALRTLGTATPAGAAGTLAELLDALPYLARHLADAPEQLQRRLFETTQLTVRLTGSDDVSFQITLPEHQCPASASAALTDADPCS